MKLTGDEYAEAEMRQAYETVITEFKKEKEVTYPLTNQDMNVLIFFTGLFGLTAVTIMILMCTLTPCFELFYFGGWGIGLSLLLGFNALDCIVDLAGQRFKNEDGRFVANVNVKEQIGFAALKTKQRFFDVDSPQDEVILQPLILSVISSSKESLGSAFPSSPRASLLFD
jgi:hypothetical protein